VARVRKGAISQVLVTKQLLLVSACLVKVSYAHIKPAQKLAMGVALIWAERELHIGVK
jgi:hypothetical protein